MTERTKAEVLESIVKCLCDIKRDGDYMRLYMDGVIIATVCWPSPNPWGQLIHLALEYGNIPDWPNNAGDALTLCLEIALDNNWQITITPLRKSGRFAVDFSDGVMSPHYAEGTTPAEALARLALAALEAQAVTDE